MSRVEGTRGSLLALLSHLPRCGHPTCDRGTKRRPIASFQGADGTFLCGFCGARRSRGRVTELPYAALLRRLLQVIGGGQVIDAGAVLTLVSPADVGSVLDADEGSPGSGTGGAAR